MKIIQLMTVLTALLLVGFGADAAFSRTFSTTLSGDKEVPAVATDTSGRARIRFNRDETAVDFRVNVRDGAAITMSHLHCAITGQNGPVVAHLFGSIPGGFNVNGELANFTLTQANIVADAGCTPAITTMAELAQAMRDGRVYVNVHSVAHPNGVIRGQLTE